MTSTSMPTWYIQFRKRYILPAKWAAKRQILIRQANMRTNKSIFKERERVHDQLLAAQRVEDRDKIRELSAKYEVFDWLCQKDSD